MYSCRRTTHARVHTDMRMCAHTNRHGVGGCTGSMLGFSPLQSSPMVDCPGVPPGHGRDPAVECAQSRGPEEMAPLFTTHPMGIWVHCDKGPETGGLTTNRDTLQVFHSALPVASGQDRRHVEASVLEAETLGVSMGVRHGLEGQDSPPAGAELQYRGWEGTTREPLAQQQVCLAGGKRLSSSRTEVPGIQEGPQ